MLFRINKLISIIMDAFEFVSIVIISVLFSILTNLLMNQKVIIIMDKKNENNV